MKFLLINAKKEAIHHGRPLSKLKKVYFCILTNTYNFYGKSLFNFSKIRKNVGSDLME